MMGRALLMALGLAVAIPGLAVAAERAHGDTLVILRGSDSDNYDPVRSTARAAGEVLSMMTDTLTSMDWDLHTVRPGLATRWEVSPDGRVYVFHLRPGVRFCDGRPMTAADVVYSIKRLINPATHSPVAWRAGPVEDVVALDDLTVEYRLKQPFNGLLEQLSQYFISIVDRHAVEAMGHDFGVRGFNGTGPYCWVSWTPRQELLLRRHEGYDWAPPLYHDPHPQVANIVWRIIPDDSTRAIALQSGQGDVTQYIPYYAVDLLARTPGITIAGQPAYQWDFFFGFKINRPVVNDPVIRHAVEMAVDRPALDRAIFFGQVTPSDTYLNPRAQDAAPFTVATYDPEGARRLLTANGWLQGPDGIRVRNGQRASFLFYGLSEPTADRLVQALQAYLHRVGIEMRIRLWEPTIGWSKLATQEFDAFAMSYAYLSAEDSLDLFFPSSNIPTPNRMNWRNARTDSLLAEATASLDPQARANDLAEVQHILTDSDVWLPLGHETLSIASTARVRGVRAHGQYGIGLYKGLDIQVVAP